MDGKERTKNAEGYLVIRRAQNGYTVDISGNSIIAPHVFETFDGLVTWMRENLKGADS